MNESRMTWYKKGLKDGIPIALGYFAVSFTLGIAAKNAGFSAFQSMITSMLINASAGEFAGFTLMAAGAGLLEVVLMEAIANARYLLMSCALSQKLSPDTPLHHRLLLGFYLTDEFFGLSVSVPKTLNPFYTYGMISLGAPAWAFGTYFGCLMGNVLPVNIVNALSVSLYAMFLAIIVPPARKNKTLLVLIIISMLASYLFGILPIVSEISSGVRIILLTILLSGAAAILFPIKEDVTNES
ncbi:MAG: AzlC family ABC transporter permease [Lachnospiraceae bacterium]|nr:AzlC family ABC transporter permease [Lachnospiraceae bacterium]MDD6170455.1 AzlC family ABC transporter permease [Lachnospiraceae bacterium]MDY4838712.1 AzlC family ABC transporter permease [Lachnospiraceae bacterium]